MSVTDKRLDSNVFDALADLEKGLASLESPASYRWWGARASIMGNPVNLAAGGNHLTSYVFSPGSTPRVNDVLLPTGNAIVIVSTQFIHQPGQPAQGTRVSFSVSRSDDLSVVLPADDARSGVCYENQTPEITSYVAGAVIPITIDPGIYDFTWKVRAINAVTSASGFWGDPLVLIVFPF